MSWYTLCSIIWGERWLFCLYWWNHWHCFNFLFKIFHISFLSLLSPLHTFETKCHMYLIFSVIHVNFHYFILIFLFSPGDELLFTTEETGKETFDIISLKNTLPYSIAYKVYISYLLELGVGLWCLTPLSTIFQLYRSDCYLFGET